MATINVSESTKTRFKTLKRKRAAKLDCSISEDDFIDHLLNLEEKK